MTKSVVPVTENRVVSCVSKSQHRDPISNRKLSIHAEQKLTYLGLLRYTQQLSPMETLTTSSIYDWWRSTSNSPDVCKWVSQIHCWSHSLLNPMLSLKAEFECTKFETKTGEKRWRLSEQNFRKMSRYAPWEAPVHFELVIAVSNVRNQCAGRSQ